MRTALGIATAAILFLTPRAFGTACTAILTKGYVNLFKLALKSSFLTPERAAEIAESPAPVNPIEFAPRNLETQFLKQSFRNLLPKINAKDWPVIQVDLRSLLRVQNGDAVQVASAKNDSRLIFAPIPKVFTTPKIPLLGVPDRHVSWADRKDGERLYFVGGLENALHVLRDSSPTVVSLPTGCSINSTVHIYKETPDRWLLLFSSISGWDHRIVTLTFNPYTLSFTQKAQILVEHDPDESRSNAFKVIENVNWIVSPDGVLHYTFTNFYGTYIGRPGKTLRKLQYTVEADEYTNETMPVKSLTMKGGRVLMAAIGRNKKNEMHLMIFEPFKSLKPIRELRDPEMKYTHAPDLIQHRGRIYAAASGVRESDSQSEYFTDIWDISSGKKDIHSYASTPGPLGGPPQLHSTSNGRLLLALRLSVGEIAFHMQIFAPLEGFNPIYELFHKDPKIQNSMARGSGHFPKLIENKRGELLVAGSARMLRQFYIFHPETSQAPTFTYNFGSSHPLAPNWSPREDGRLDVVFADGEGKSHLIRVMSEEDKN